MEIGLDDLSGAEIAAFLEEHVRELRAVTPRGSSHALDLSDLRRPDITFWVLRLEGRIAGCCALRELDPHHGEVKSMRTAGEFRRRGMAARLLDHLVAEARRRGYRRLSLETGAFAFFAPARALYERHGFTPSPPFGSYCLDPNSVFLTRMLEAGDR